MFVMSNNSQKFGSRFRCRFDRSINYNNNVKVLNVPLSTEEFKAAEINVGFNTGTGTMTKQTIFCTSVDKKQKTIYDKDNAIE